VKDKPVTRFMLANEAIRLVLQQEPNHDLLTGKRQPISRQPPAETGSRSNSGGLRHEGSIHQ
jgi:hypothetical protein